MTRVAKASITVLSFLIFIACRQADDSRNPFPNEIRNSKLKTHVNIPGTRVFLVPPKGFKISSTFKGLEKGDITRIEVTDLDGTNFSITAPTFSKDQIEQAGYPVLEFKELTVNGFPAKMAFLRGRNSIRVYGFVFGDSTFSTIIWAVFDGREGATRDQVRRALLSVYYDTSMNLNSYAPAVFTLDDSKSKFKFAKSEDGRNIYSLRGIAKKDYKDEPYVVAVNLPIAGLSLRRWPTNWCSSAVITTWGILRKAPPTGFHHLPGKHSANWKGAK